MSSTSDTPVLTPTSSAWNSPYLTLTSNSEDVENGLSTIPNQFAGSLTSPYLSYFDAFPPSTPGILESASTAISPSTGILTPASSRRSSILQASRSPLACPFCPYRKPFQSERALQSHMSSVAHAPKIFHCPTNVLGLAKNQTATRQFTTLSGLTQHLESGACGDGRATLELAMDLIQGKLDEMGLGGVQLLKRTSHTLAKKSCASHGGHYIE